MRNKLHEKLHGPGRKGDGKRYRLGTAAVVTASLLGLSCGAEALEIKTGNEDVQVRFDNTLRYTLGLRVAQQNLAVMGDPASSNTDDGDRNFAHGIVNNRIDLLSELDASYKKRFGFRISGAGWYDAAYDSSLDNTNPASSNHLENGQPVAGRFNSRAKRYYLGPNGELLDAFLFGKTVVGEIPVNLKVGRHTVYWGEGLMAGGAIHGISYGQSPLDLAKALPLPGIEAKELFRPLNSISMQVQPTPDLTFMGQYFLEWEQMRYPEAGTYLGFSDVMQESAESLIAAPGVRFLRGAPSEPNPFRNWGVGVRYSPEALDGTIGVYYRKTADLQPQVAILPGASSIPGIAGTYYLTYGTNIDIVGVSLSKQLLGVSVGAELSHRWNMPLNSNAVMVASAPTDGQTFGARGNTWHGVLNFLGLINKTALFDSAQWIAEFTWNHLEKVTQNRAALKSSDVGYNAIDQVSKDFFGGALVFTPTWFQVLPGVDMTLPFSYGQGISGNSAVAAGGNHGSGSWSAGLGFDVFTKYKVDLKYVNFFGQIEGGVANDLGSAGLKDRDMVTLTLRTTF